MTEAAVTKEDINQQQYRSDDDAALERGLAHVAGLSYSRFWYTAILKPLQLPLDPTFNNSNTHFPSAMISLVAFSCTPHSVPVPPATISQKFPPCAWYTWP